MGRPVKVVILGDATDAARAFRSVRDEAGQTVSGLDRASANMSRAGSAMTRGVTLPLLGVAAGALKLSATQEIAEAKLVSTFESMGAAAWTNTEALKANAAALQEQSTFGDEAIIGMQSVLLTFGNLTDQVGEGNDAFSRATQLGLDMSAALGTDLEASAIQLGKALNDPVAGITALTRVGVTFTDAQKDLIGSLVEGGDTLGAQQVILDELEKQFAGTASAIADTDAGKMRQAMNSVGDAMESMGAIIAPVAASIANAFAGITTKFAALPEPAQKIIVAVLGIVAAVGPMLLIGAKLIKAFQVIKTAWLAVNAAMLLNPFVLIGLAVAALVVVVVKNWDTIVAFLTRTWEGIKTAVAAVSQWFKDTFAGAIDFVVGLFLNFTLPGLLISHWDDIMAAVTAVKDWIIEKWEDVIDFFTGLPAKITSAVSGLFDGFKDAFRSALNWVISKWNNLSFTLPSITLPGILGGGTVGGQTFSTPNIPTLHQGGLFNSGRGEGLALLQDRERVLSVAQNRRFEASGGLSGGITMIFNGDVYNGDDFETAVRDALIRIERRNGSTGLALV